ncbi:MAG TPA: NAD(P)H-dependent oxidoreductase [Steroidobacteraceae bacterium]|nr:NAD(P)H-dependent oxidoreductase [Steroidobacteraceae bacterium]
MRVVAIAGSLRRESCNHRLLEAAASLSPPGMEVRIMRELGSIPLYDADLERDSAGGPLAVRKLREAIAAADGLLIATPEYNHSFPGVLKNAIDWLSRPGPVEALNGKPVAIIGASSGQWGTRLAQAALRQVFYATESRVLPAPALYASACERLFDSDGLLTDQETRDRLGGLLRAFGNWIRLQPPISVYLEASGS